MKFFVMEIKEFCKKIYAAHGYFNDPYGYNHIMQLVLALGIIVCYPSALDSQLTCYENCTPIIITLV